MPSVAAILSTQIITISDLIRLAIGMAYSSAWMEVFEKSTAIMMGCMARNLHDNPS
jgi:hypothetical protein